MICQNQISVYLCNVALYKSDDRKNDWTPIEISGISYGTISADDFINNKYRRVLVTIKNKKYYVDFPELHLMNPELYVGEPMYLSKKNLNISIVEDVDKHYKNKLNIIENKQSTRSNMSNIDVKLKGTFHYVYKYIKNDEGDPLTQHKSQIYAAYRALTLMKEKNKKGCILQVHTGEGKSLIIEVLAELLARQGNTVHIATSNIILAARDFEKSYKFYKKSGDEDSKYSLKTKRPSILLHSKEKKYIKKILSGKLMTEEEKKAFYDDENFKNSTSLNTSVFEKNGRLTSNIIYSTFLNFEAYYLSQYDKNSSYIADYLNNTYLLIDEADTILIDELINGTILSKPMNSNAEEVLNMVYDERTRYNSDAETLLKRIKDQFPECTDITEEHIKKMFDDIEHVRDKEFCEKKRYIISTDENDEKIVIPFDSDHKGIAEPSKEFGGFVHQFIGLKERKENPSKYGDLKIQSLSMNYLFISHPIYVNKYKGVCGVTGTVGSKNDKQILEKYYNLVIEKIPRNKMNLRKDLPLILCDDIDDRNKIICHEINALHEMGYPVLVVFNNINEITDVKNILIDFYKIKDHIAIFTGSSNENSEEEKNYLENNSGKPKAITLGTNFCGRGVSIEPESLPLFTIVTYFSDDNRSINQALGRSGRNGMPGLTRIICTKIAFSKITEIPDAKAMTEILEYFDAINLFQAELFQKITMKYGWIFNDIPYNKELKKEDIEKLHKYTMNINRITASKFQFPICMSVETFLEIQAQRIYSIKNCPECKQTWHLFRIYLRELILESWSLFLDSVQSDFQKKVKMNEIDSDKYNSFFNFHYCKYLSLLSNYIPLESELTITELFFHIHDKVGDAWEHKIMKSIPQDIIAKSSVTRNGKSSTVFRIGFFPISLSQNSGVKISPLSESEKTLSENSQLYIVDPELKYINSKTQKPFSITRVLDKIFNAFRKMIDEKLQGLFGLRLFLKRTLGNCEFGICVDPCFENTESFINCLVDKNPIIILTICTKSTFCWIAGILIMLLIFAKSLFTYISGKLFNPANITKDIIGKAKEIIQKLFLGGGDDDEDEKEIPLISQKLNQFTDKILEDLKLKVQKKLANDDIGISLISDAIFNLINTFFNSDTSENLFSKIQINKKAEKFLNGKSFIGKLIQIIGLSLVLLFQFIHSFKKNDSLKFDSLSKSAASSYQREQKDEKKEQMSSFDSYNKVEKGLKKKIDDELNSQNS